MNGTSVRALAIDATGVLRLTTAAEPNHVFALGITFGGLSHRRTLLQLVAGVGQAGSLGDGGPATSAQLDLAADSLVERSGIAVAPDGTIFIADTRNSTIRSVGAAASSEPG